MSTLVWLRHDLRLRDQPAFHFAAARGEPVIPVFIHEPVGPWAPGAASRAFLHDALEALGRDLEALGSRLILRRGAPAEVLQVLAAECNATALAFNRRVEPAGRVIDGQVESRLSSRLEVRIFNGSLLTLPAQVMTTSGGPYRVFTPYWRQVHGMLRAHPPAPLPAPSSLRPPSQWPASVTLESLSLLPAHAWHRSLRAHWPAGEAGAWSMLERFLGDPVDHYTTQRDFPADAGSSKLSPYLHAGQLSPGLLWDAIHQRAAARGALEPSAQELAWLRQVAWREFAHHLLWHFPTTTDAPLRPDFAAFPWREDAAGFEQWCRGLTGFPLVDAGMRELWETGWMHNRVRMVVASFLTKDLGIDWRAGAAWFWDTLVDANLANNTLGWQWTAGCGADAAPYFRVFNPTAQSLKFDPQAAYITRWLPALSGLSPADRHAPAAAPPLALQAAGLALGRDYPGPMVDHAVARREALARLAGTKA